MKAHPDYPDVYAMPIERVRAIVGASSAICSACPYVDDENCAKRKASRRCGEGWVWFGQHLYIARKLEGK